MTSTTNLLRPHVQEQVDACPGASHPQKATCCCRHPGIPGQPSLQKSLPECRPETTNFQLRLPFLLATSCCAAHPFLFFSSALSPHMLCAALTLQRACRSHILRSRAMEDLNCTKVIWLLRGLLPLYPRSEQDGQRWVDWFSFEVRETRWLESRKEDSECSQLGDSPVLPMLVELGCSVLTFFSCMQPPGSQAGPASSDCVRSEVH